MVGDIGPHEEARDKQQRHQKNLLGLVNTLGIHHGYKTEIVINEGYVKILVSENT
jgi:hypothetical protein